MKRSPVVAARKVGLFREGRSILKEVSLDVWPGEMLGLIGPNGAGKTSLIRVLLGLSRPSQGRVTVLGREPVSLGPLRERIGYLPQRSTANGKMPFSVRDVVAMGALTPALLGRSYPDRFRFRVDEILEEAGIDHLAHRSLADLSGGERQAALLARSLVRDPDLLVLDEPTAGLDFAAQRRFMDLLDRLRQRRGAAVIMVSHDLASVARAVDRLALLNRRLYALGLPQQVLESPGLKGAYSRRALGSWEGGPGG